MKDRLEAINYNIFDGMLLPLKPTFAIHTSLSVWLSLFQFLSIEKKSTTWSDCTLQGKSVSDNTLVICSDKEEPQL